MIFYVDYFDDNNVDNMKKSVRCHVILVGTFGYCVLIWRAHR